MKLFAALFLLSFTTAQAADSVFLSAGSCDQINEAVRALPLGGGTVQLAAGEYICDSPVVISRDNVSLIGAGREKTILRLAHGKALPALVIGVLEVAPQQTVKWGVQYYPVRETKNIRVEKLSIIGAFSGAAPDADRECYDVENKSSRNCANDGGKYIRNNGITIRRAKDVLITDVRADRHLSGGMVLEKLSSNIRVNGFYASGNAFDGFAGYETTTSVFRNMQLTKNVMSGISVDLDFERNLFYGVVSSDNGDNGIFSHGVSNAYKNMTVENNRNYGFWIDGRRNRQPDGTDLEEPGTCDNHRFYNLTVSGNAQAGIRLNAGCKRNLGGNLNISTGQPKIECVSLAPDAEFQFVGTFVCKQN